MDNLLQDLRYGLRVLKRNPGFAATAILTLALGITATTAIFSVVDAIVFNPLPFPNAARLMRVRSVVAAAGGADPVILSYGLWQRQFGSDPAVLARGIHLGDQIFPVVRIMPPHSNTRSRRSPWISGPP